MFYLQGSNGDVDIENRLVGTVWEEKGEMNLESSTETCTLPHVKQTVGICYMVQGA